MSEPLCPCCGRRHEHYAPEPAPDPHAAHKRLDFSDYSVDLAAFEPADDTWEAKTLAWLAYLVACEAARNATDGPDRVAGCYAVARKAVLGLAGHVARPLPGEGGAPC